MTQALPGPPCPVIPLVLGVCIVSPAPSGGLHGGCAQSSHIGTANWHAGRLVLHRMKGLGSHGLCGVQTSLTADQSIYSISLSNDKSVINDSAKNSCWNFPLEL